MFYTPPPPPDYPEIKMTEEEEQVHDQIWKRNDETEIAILQQKLNALGCNDVSAETLHQNISLSLQVEKQYDILKKKAGFNDLVSIVENIQRERGF